MSAEQRAASLERGIDIRLTNLQEICRGLRGSLGDSESSLAKAFQLLDEYPNAVREFTRIQLPKTVDSQSRIQVLLPVLRHVIQTLDLIEQHLSHGRRKELSEPLAGEVRAEMAALELSHYEVILSHGEATNFTTLNGDLRRHLFGHLTIAPMAPQYFALFRVPRVEGAGVQWRPILLGHEVTHVAVEEHDAVGKFNLPTKFDFTSAGSIENPASRPGAPPSAIAQGLYQLAESWATELICDAHALYRFGPSAVAAIAEYFHCIGAMEQAAPSHPPGSLRVKLMLEQLPALTGTRLEAILEPWNDSVPNMLADGEPWAKFLAELFYGQAAELVRTVDELPASPYAIASRLYPIGIVADRLLRGEPGPHAWEGPNGSAEPVLPADVVNAVWITRVEVAPTPCDRLGSKTLESLEFIDHWMGAGGEAPPTPPVSADPGIAQGTLLSAEEITQRLGSSAADSRLALNPLLHKPRGSGIDVRLGTRFIAFRRSAVSAFDPLDAEHDPRSIQMYVELSRRERFVLHPQEVVLGATLEYVVMPPDLSGQVITRSSFGRLGLLSATAVQVHPNFRGCLTLELVNLGTIPITLTPGERIAQLILWSTTPTAPQVEKYDCPVGPEFSRVRDDVETKVLRKLRTRA